MGVLVRKKVSERDLLCCFAWFFFWYAARSMSYGKLLPGTALFAPMEWLLHVRLRAQDAPFGSGTPHCFSTSTGPFGFGTLGFGCSSFFAFFLFGSFSPPSPSVFRFLLFLGPALPPSSELVALTALFFALLTLFSLPSMQPPSPRPRVTESSIVASPSLSSPFSLTSLARWAASLASFFFRARSCFF